MTLTHITTLTANVGAPIPVGPVTDGMRGIVAITGGSFEGPRLRGAVMPMGADWALLQPDGTAHVDTRYLQQMQDGTFVGIRNRGNARPAPGQDMIYTGQSTPAFEAPRGKPLCLDEYSHIHLLLHLQLGKRPGPVALLSDRTRHNSLK